jgi:hypothetical protein
LHKEILFESLKGRDHSEDQDEDERIRSKLILRNRAGVWIGFIWLRI